MDVIVSLVNSKVVKFSRLDADNNHPYGHGRVESIAALGQGCLITGGAIGIIVSSARELYDSYRGNVVNTYQADWKQVAFFAFAALVSYFITKWLKINGDKLNSPALLADSEHYKVDLITNIASGLAIFVVMLSNNPILDPLIALLFSFYIIYGAFGLIKTSINELMDHDIPEEVKQKVQAKIREIDARILDIHRFRARKSGFKYFLIFTLRYQIPFPFLRCIKLLRI